jgi:hypothetical protein
MITEIGNLKQIAAVLMIEELVTDVEERLCNHFLDKRTLHHFVNSYSLAIRRKRRENRLSGFGELVDRAFLNLMKAGVGAIDKFRIIADRNQTMTGKMHRRLEVWQIEKINLNDNGNPPINVILEVGKGVLIVVKLGDVVGQ